MTDVPGSVGERGPAGEIHQRAPFDALIGLGSNIGDKPANIRRAIALLTTPEDVRLVRELRFYRSPPWGVREQDWFVNACIAVATSLAPHDLLARCLAVENEMKRVRERRWGPRIIDVDVLTYGNTTSDDPALTLPHPRIAERAFVLLPLRDIAPGIVIGGHGLDHWLAEVDATGVTPIDDTA